MLQQRETLRALLVTAALVGGCASAPSHPEPFWWKGNLHTHSLWSDGGDFPEMIAGWYKDHGYNFLGITEHDMLQEGEKWVDINAKDDGWPPRNESTRAALPGYRELFGKDWVQERNEGARDLIRLRAMSEYRDRFEERNRFLLMMGEEITDKGGAHMNAFNLSSAVLPRGGAGPGERIRNNLAAVAEQRADSNRSILTIINHPNYVWTLTAEEIAAIPDARLFEVYNGHALVNNQGDSLHASTERMWDVILSLRHAAGGRPVFGAANDDAHEYRAYSDTIAMPGRGWVMVRAASLEPNAIMNALARGDFYSSTGVTLEDVTHDADRIRITIAPQPGVAYRTIFIGTRKGVPLDSHPVVTAKGDTLRTTRTYSDEVGAVLAEVQGTVAEYRFRGDERYVRAKVISTAVQPDPVSGHTLGLQSAWIQPAFR